MKDQYAVDLCKEPEWQVVLTKAQAKHVACHSALAAKIMNDIRKCAEPILIDDPISLKRDGYNVMMDVIKKPS